MMLLLLGPKRQIVEPESVPFQVHILRVFSSHQVPYTHMVLSWHTCKLLLTASFICASPDLTNCTHWKPTATTFSQLSFLFQSWLFSFFSHTLSKVPSFFSPSMNSPQAGGRDVVHPAALFRACHPQAERNKGKTCVPVLQLGCSMSAWSCI